MKKVFLTLFAITGIMLTSCQKQEEPEKEKEEQKTEQEEAEKEKEETKLPKLPVRIISEGNTYRANKEILFSYDEKGRVTKVQELDMLPDAFFQEYNISYENDKLKKVEFWSSGATTNFKSIKDFLEGWQNYKGRERFKTIVYNDSGAQVTEKENNGSEQKTYFFFNFDNEGRIIQQNRHSIRRDDKGNITYTEVYTESPARFYQYDDKNHPFKNVNIYLGHHFFDMDMVSGWNSEANILPLPISSSISYVNNFIYANYIQLDISRTLKYDTDNFPIEIKTNYGGEVVTYKIEYNHKAPAQLEPETPKVIGKKVKRMYMYSINNSNYIYDDAWYFYDDKGRVSKIDSYNKNGYYKYIYYIQYSVNSDKIQYVNLIDKTDNNSYTRWSASYIYNDRMLTITKGSNYPDYNGTSTYSFNEKNQIVMIEKDRYYPIFVYNEAGNIVSREKEQQFYNAQYDTKHHPLRNVNVYLANGDAFDFEPFMYQNIIPANYVNNVVSWESRNYNGEIVKTTRTNMKYDKDDFLIEYQNGDSIYKIEYYE